MRAGAVEGFIPPVYYPVRALVFLKLGYIKCIELENFCLRVTRLVG